MSRNKGLRLLTGIFLCFLVLFSYTSIKAGDDHVVAKVGDETITEEQMKEFMSGINVPGAPVTDEKGALEELIIRSIMYQEAKKKGIDKRKDVSEQIARVERNLIIQALMREEPLFNRPVTEDLARELYEKNWMDSKYPRWVKITLLRITYKEKGLEKKAEEYAKSIRSKIKHEDFDLNPEEALKQLKKESPPPDGITIEGTQYKKIFLLKVRQTTVLLEQIPLKLKEGETSDPIPVPQQPQYVLINLTKEYPKEELPFEKVKSELLFGGGRILQQENMKTYFEKVKDKYKIEYLSK